MKLVMQLFLAFQIIVIKVLMAALTVRRYPAGCDHHLPVLRDLRQGEVAGPGEPLELIRPPVNCTLPGCSAALPCF